MTKNYNIKEIINLKAKKSKIKAPHTAPYFCKTQLKCLPIYTPANENKKAVMPITVAVKSIFVLKQERVKPKARASMLVAIPGMMRLKREVLASCSELFSKASHSILSPTTKSIKAAIRFEKCEITFIKLTPASRPERGIKN